MRARNDDDGGAADVGRRSAGMTLVGNGLAVRVDSGSRQLTELLGI
jgi:hypothetical protein